MSTERVILVTGMPRSGTTWVGRVLSKAAPTRFVHEPFNISSPRCACGVHFDKWFYYVNAENESAYHAHFEHLVSSATNRHNLLNAISRARRARSLSPVKAFMTQLRASQTVVKGPLAACSAAWLADTFDMTVVVVVRHPAAVAESYRRLQWSHPFDHFLGQPSLMRDCFDPFTDEITAFSTGTHDFVEQAALLWKLIYHVLLRESVVRKWIVVRHEDLATDATSGFTALFRQLELDYTSQAQHAVAITSSPRNPVLAADPYSVLRNSEEMARHWRAGLSDEEMERIRLRAGPAATAHYSEDEWATGKMMGHELLQ